jgi:hypothetical protein
MSNKQPLVAICPIFGLQIREVLYGIHSEEEVERYFKELYTKFSEGIPITPQIMLRKIKQADFDQLNTSLPPNFQNLPSELSQGTFVFEFTTDLNDYEQVIGNLLLALRLYKKGRVFSNIIWHKNNTMMVYLQGITSHEIDSFSYFPIAYQINVEEIEKIKELLETVEKTELAKTANFRIAVERFSRSYEGRRWDDKLIDLAIAFEALFIEGNKSSNIPAGEFVGIGCSMLIGTNVKERKKIKAFVEQAFTIRNKVVHGSTTNESIKINDEEYLMQDFIAQFEEYFRISLRKLM